MADASGVTGTGPAFGWLELPDGARLRTAHWPASGEVRGTFVVLTGRAEFIEKYEETARTLLMRGFEVFAMDWRNQGLSTRPSPNPQRHHVEDFAALAGDLERFVAEVVAPRARGPLVLLAHSMGGLVATLHAARHPERFRAAILSAPMHDINLRGFPAWLARFLADAACALGFGARYAFGQGDYDPREAAFDGNVITGDPRRYAVFHDAYRDRPELRVGGVSFAWLRAAFRASDAVRTTEPLDRVRYPALLLSAPGDQVVDSAAQRAVAKRWPSCELVEYAQARHEVLMECDAIRDRVWADIDAFLVRHSL
ncbi:alpha/beta hydrolase [Azospirillum sp. TSO22-1]|uniref:alpha/beta fold hydrolase n=1 Tax=Azospirillum sp. TSO22-1 TaxID=716789 RepID=UPI000D608341|nr:alpha/beta hydrolase [Azospirillum sp. TSO22-1]PWC53088.1 lysophospholipase [Azospirillum sp. TSO22-1]